MPGGCTDANARGCGSPISSGTCPTTVACSAAMLLPALSIGAAAVQHSESQFIEPHTAHPYRILSPEPPPPRA